MCQVVLQNNARLGSMNGATASQAVYYGCCTMKLDSLVSQANWEWTNQNFGFIDTESDGTDDIRDFFNDTSGKSNKQSWFDHLEDRPGWFTGDNSPIVVSYGTNSTAATNIHNNSKLKANVNTAPRGGGPSCGGGQPAFYYVYPYIDHNNGGC